MLEDKDKQIQDLSYENTMFKQHIERQRVENERLISLIDKYKEKFERIERLTLFYDDNVRKEVYSIAKSCLEKE